MYATSHQSHNQSLVTMLDNVVSGLSKMLLVVAYYIIPTILILFGLRKYRENQWGKCINNAKLTGQVALITGANSGIGYEIAKELAKREAEVVFACRNVNAATEAICKINYEINNKAIMVPMELNLACLKSVEKFVKCFTSRYTKLNILVNNAGVSFPDKMKVKTEDGFEIHFGVNHLGHFLLTNLLLDTLKESKPSRILIISSTLHEKGKIYLDDLNLERVQGKPNGYANSKLANAYFGQELAKRTREFGVNIYTICPGWVYTNLFRHFLTKWYLYILIAPIAFLYMRNCKQGAQTAIYCATELELNHESGHFYRDCKLYKSKIEFDDGLSKTLWEASENMIKEKL